MRTPLDIYVFIQIQIFLFPIKEPFQAEQLTKNLIQWLWIDYIDWKIKTFYETNKSKFNHTIDIVIVAFECMQSVPITTDVMSSNLDQGEVYNIMW